MGHRPRRRGLGIVCMGGSLFYGFSDNNTGHLPHKVIVATTENFRGAILDNVGCDGFLCGVAWEDTILSIPYYKYDSTPP